MRRSRLATPPLLALVLALSVGMIPSASAGFAVTLSPSTGVTISAANGGGASTAVESCPAGSAVTALDSVTTEYMNGLTPVCRPFVKPGFDLLPSDTQSRSLGAIGETGSTSTVSCPAGSFLVGINGRTGDIFDGLYPLCQAFSGDALTGSPAQQALIGGNGGGETGAQVCPSGGIVTGMEGEVIAYDNQTVMATIRLQCSTVSGYDNFTPDAIINVKGDGIYNDTGALQTMTKKIPAGKKASFDIFLGNDSAFIDTLVLTGEKAKKPFTARYADGLGATITPDVVSTGWQAVDVDPAGSYATTLIVSSRKSAKKGQKATILVSVASAKDPWNPDVVVAKVVIK